MCIRDSRKYRLQPLIRIIVGNQALDGLVVIKLERVHESLLLKRQGFQRIFDGMRFKKILDGHVEGRDKTFQQIRFSGPYVEDLPRWKGSYAAIPTVA